MRKLTLVLLVILMHTIATVAQPQDLTIKGKIEGIKKGRLYLLTQTSEETTDTLGHCDFKRGKFTLQTTITEPLVTQLIVEGFSGGFMLFAEPGVNYQAYLSNNEDFYIKGGNLNEAYVTHMSVSDSLNIIIKRLQERYDAMRASKKFRSASQINDSLRNEQNKLRELTATFLDTNDNIIKAYTIYSNIIMRDANLTETRRLYNTLGVKSQSSQYGRLIEERIARMAKTEGGAQAPDFTLPDLKGNPITMSLVKGKIKIIDFWASWCGPCRLNNPTLRKIYEKYHSKGLEIIGVSLDTNRESWEKAIEKDGLSWLNVSSLKGWKCDLVSQYSVKGIPALFILDEDNNIIATGLKGELLEKFIEEKLK